MVKSYTIYQQHINLSIEAHSKNKQVDTDHWLSQHIQVLLCALGTKQKNEQSVTAIFFDVYIAKVNGNKRMSIRLLNKHLMHVPLLHEMKHTQ